MGTMRRIREVLTSAKFEELAAPLSGVSVAIGMGTTGSTYKGIRNSSISKKKCPTVRTLISGKTRNVLFIPSRSR